MPLNSLSNTGATLTPDALTPQAGDTAEMLMAKILAAQAAMSALLPQTGDLKVKFTMDASNVDGWVPCEGGTIGVTAASNPNYAGPEYEALFIHLWNQAGDEVCPVIGGRGIDAASDAAAGKAITLPDFRARVLVGFDPGAGSSRMEMIDAAVLGASGGSSTVALSVDQLPSHEHSLSALAYSGGGGDAVVPLGNGSGSTIITTSSTGGGLAHSNVQPSIIAGIVLMKL